MIARGKGTRSQTTGLSLIEVMVSCTICAVIGYGILGLIDMGESSRETVSMVSGENQDLRDSNNRLMNDFQATSDSQVTVESLADSNHQITFMVPVTIGGNPTWGARDQSLGTDPESQSRENWRVRYTVKQVVDGSGGINRQLVRQVLDTGDIVQIERVVAEGLKSGLEVPPGFSVVKIGDMWQLSMATVGKDGCEGRKVEFHVRTRN